MNLRGVGLPTPYNLPPVCSDPDVDGQSHVQNLPDKPKFLISPSCQSSGWVRTILDSSAGSRCAESFNGAAEAHSWQGTGSLDSFYDHGRSFREVRLFLPRHGVVDATQPLPYRYITSNLGRLGFT